MGQYEGVVSSRVTLNGIQFAPWTEDEVVHHVMRTMRGRSSAPGGWLVTPNVDILRKITVDPAMRATVHSATLFVADGMPLVWASRLQGASLPERVTGASLLVSLCAAAAHDGRRVHLVGGETGVAELAAQRLRETYPGLVADGWSPPFGFEASEEGLAEICRRSADSDADLVFCGFGFPKQERVIARLVEHRPEAWYVGCGASITFAAGRIPRAPSWMQRTGLEWVHRLVKEPRRLARRYLREDVPFAVRLLVGAACARRDATESGIGAGPRTN